MSDMLNEKFEEFASEHAAVLSEAVKILCQQ